MGRHEAQPEKRGGRQMVVYVFRTRAHTWFTFWKHMAAETSAGLFAIFVFEAYRSEWLLLLGVSSGVH